MQNKTKFSYWVSLLKEAVSSVTSTDVSYCSAFINLPTLISFYTPVILVFLSVLLDLSLLYSVSIFQKDCLLCCWKRNHSLRNGAEFSASFALYSFLDCITLLFSLSTANSLQSLFLSIFSYAVYYWQCSLLCPSSLALKLGWASAVPPVLAEVLGDMSDSSHTFPEIPYTHTCIRVQCSVLVAVHIYHLYI